jgi:RNA polymerase sigma factor (sigma-70 family)
MMFEHSSDRVIDLERALNTLKPKEHKAVMLYMEGRTQSQVGELLGWNQSSISRVLSKLRIKIADSYTLYS